MVDVPEDRALIRIGDFGVVCRVVFYENTHRVGNTRCGLRFVAVSDNYPRPVWAIDTLPGSFAWKMFDVATCLWCIG